MASIQMKKVITNMTMTPTTPGSPPSPTVGTSDAAALASANDTNKKPRFSFQVGSLFIIFSALLDQQIPRSTRRAPRGQSLFTDAVERAVQLEELADDVAVRDPVPTR